MNQKTQSVSITAPAETCSGKKQKKNNVKASIVTKYKKKIRPAKFLTSQCLFSAIKCSYLEFGQAALKCGFFLLVCLSIISPSFCRCFCNFCSHMTNLNLNSKVELKYFLFFIYLLFIFGFRYSQLCVWLFIP